MCVARTSPNSSFAAETTSKKGCMKGSPCWSYKRFIFTDEGCESCKHCPASFIPVDKAVESKRTSQPVAQILKINHRKLFSWFPRRFFSLIPVFRYYVNRDTLFCYHRASEVFLQRLMALYVASHYKVGLVLLPSNLLQCGVFWGQQCLW